MSRITIEDCLKVIPNRFELTLIASERARELAKEEKTKVESKDREKPTVMALREIASGKLRGQSIEKLKLFYKIDESSGFSLTNAHEKFSRVKRTKKW